jgi:prevent-host-death family protein
MSRLAASELRGNLADTLNRVEYRGERIVLERHGKDVAALVPLEDLALLERMEARLDLEAVREALEERGSIPWKTVKARLGL